ncbi:hypothetical protein ES708_15278 [subsurface metagenome]
MFLCLRFDTLFGIYQEQNQINGIYTGEHIFDKTLMTRYINHLGTTTAGQHEIGKADINGHLTFFFFLQAVRVHAAECFNQGTFAVIHVTSCAN